jgi:hypothetical protein
MMRGERIFGSAATEGGALDMAQTTVAFIGMMEWFRSPKILPAAGTWPIDEGQELNG